MQLFYTPNIPAPVFNLDETESKHAVRVLRLVNGDGIQLIDGKGNFHEAVIADAHPKRCQVRIDKTITEFGKRNH